MARPSFKPTNDQRLIVEAGSAFGASHAEIAGELGISEKTLRRHFREELDGGAKRALRRVSVSVYRQAVGSPAEYDGDGNVLRDEQKPVFAAGAFYLKTQGGWRETNRFEVTGKDGGPLQTMDLTKLSDGQLDALEAVFGPLAATGGDDEGDQGGAGEAGGAG